ncbi:methyltransferase domain-containing protein [Nocardia terpenica]|uniref:Methyltransferase domain-containing protein n=2 Tax=Nocardia terpenica TaxID=455432 RepID=A0A6G9ZB15_9NOCA|nr:methyltransferase domain-containing protein [Nocardia terpenica]
MSQGGLMIRMRKTAAMVAGTAAVGAAGWLWFGDRAPFPYSQRWMLDVPLPMLTGARLDAILQPRPGERMLEIGPGTGLQALHIAPQLGESGRLDVLDVQPEMLSHVLRRAGDLDITNIVATQADARCLPFDDGSFDAVYLITALGEIPDIGAVLREAERVLTPDGRLVVGEFFDPHWVTLTTLLTHADAAGLHLTTRSGLGPAYLARLHPCRKARGTHAA